MFPYDNEEILLYHSIDGYFPQRFIARGGQGIAYLAHHVESDKLVVLKIAALENLDADSKARFVREGKILKELDHPNVVKINKFGESTVEVVEAGIQRSIAVFYLAMDYLPGMPLSKLLEQPRLSQEEALKLIEQISLALDYIHNKQIKHRDIKPANIIFSREQPKPEPRGGHRGGTPVNPPPRELPPMRAVLIDFGLAKLSEEEQTILTRTNIAAGTLPYMAPEQFSDFRDVSHSADIYSFSIIIYQILTGESLHSWPTTIRSLDKQKLPEAVRERLWEVFNKALAEDPEGRYSSAGELVVVLKNIFS